MSNYCSRCQKRDVPVNVRRHDDPKCNGLTYDQSVTCGLRCKQPLACEDCERCVVHCDCGMEDEDG